MAVSPAKENAMRTVKAAAVEMSPVLYSREGTVDKVVRTIHQLGREVVQFATFPETVVPYYPYFSFVQPAYQIVAGREHLKLLERAVQCRLLRQHTSDACKKREWSCPSESTNDGGTFTTRSCSSCRRRLDQRRQNHPHHHERWSGVGRRVRTARR